LGLLAQSPHVSPYLPRAMLPRFATRDGPDPCGLAVHRALILSNQVMRMSQPRGDRSREHVRRRRQGRDPPPWPASGRAADRRDASGSEPAGCRKLVLGRSLLSDQ
jgi:hypothetical protein